MHVLSSLRSDGLWRACQSKFRHTPETEAWFVRFVTITISKYRYFFTKLPNPLIHADTSSIIFLSYHLHFFTIFSWFLFCFNRRRNGGFAKLVRNELEVLLLWAGRCLSFFLVRDRGLFYPVFDTVSLYASIVSILVLV